MDTDIRGKGIVITGAGRGLGRALALGLAAEGARIAVIARRQEQADATVAEIAVQHPDAPAALAVAADVADEEQVRAAAAAIDASWGRVDGLINNAGRLPNPRQTVLDLELSNLRQTIDSNLVSAFLMTKYIAPLMIRGGGGRIIYITSIAAVQAGPGSAAYGATKAGINNLTNVVHQELADQGIRTVAIAPGLTDTPGMRESASEEHITRVSARYPGGRVGQPEDIVPFAAFLCSAAAEHLSGTVLTIRPFTG